MVEGSWFLLRGSGFRVQGSGLRVQGSGFRAPGFRSEGLEFWFQCVQCSVVRVSSSRLRVEGIWIKV